MAQQTITPGVVTPQVITISPAPKIPIAQSYAAKQAVVLGSLQLICGVLSVSFQIAGLCVEVIEFEIGVGIWCGVFFILAGSFGIASGLKKSNSMIVAFLVFSIFATIFALTLLIVSAIYISLLQDYYYGYYVNHDTSRAMYCILLILSVSDGIFAIWSAIICCSAMCCRDSTSAVTYIPGQMQYVTNGPNGQLILMAQPGSQPGILYQPTQNNQVQLGTPAISQQFLAQQPMAQQPMAQQSMAQQPVAFAMVPPSYSQTTVGAPYQPQPTAQAPPAEKPTSPPDLQ